jgi:hypothetical protein
MQGRNILRNVLHHWDPQERGIAWNIKATASFSRTVLHEIKSKEDSA